MLTLYGTGDSTNRAITCKQKVSALLSIQAIISVQRKIAPRSTLDLRVQRLAFNGMGITGSRAQMYSSGARQATERRAGQQTEPPWLGCTWTVVLQENLRGPFSTQDGKLLGADLQMQQNSLC